MSIEHYAKIVVGVSREVFEEKYDWDQADEHELEFFSDCYDSSSGIIGYQIESVEDGYTDIDFRYLELEVVAACKKFFDLTGLTANVYLTTVSY